MGNTTSLCATCGVEFAPTARRRGRPDSRFCTAACRTLWERAHSTRTASRPSTAESAPAEPVETVETVETVESDAPLPTPLPPLGTEAACPHCGHQLTIVNFVLPSLDSAADVEAPDDDGGVRNHYSTG
ncbi:hypothetical protein ACFYZ5_17700 [Streptomyces chartreusis]|uniref:hypothetical protein n=1 Tax=Streptomyces chartreusis TaxID=1969 RepID=UPI003677FD77